MADGLYAAGYALVFFDAAEQRWVLALPDIILWTLWYERRTQTHPLESRDDDTYPSSVYIEYCPWCRQRLVGDPTRPTSKRRRARTGGGAR